MLRSSSFLKRTVWTPEMALTTVDLPCATCPIVPMLMVAWLAKISGLKAFMPFKEAGGGFWQEACSLLMESWLKATSTVIIMCAQGKERLENFEAGGGEDTLAQFQAKLTKEGPKQAFSF